MPIKIVSNPLAAGDISDEQIRKLTRSYFRLMKKKKRDRPTDSAVTLKERKDSKSIWFSKAEIDEFFIENNPDNVSNGRLGLRIYFSVYDTENNPLPGVPAEFDNKQTAVLMVTILNGNGDSHEDQKEPNKNSVLLPVELQARNHGELCPPPRETPQSTKVCSGAIIN